MEVRDKLYIGGAWVDPTSDDTLAVVDSASEEVIATVPRGSPADVDKAVAAARAAFAHWAAVSPQARAKYASRIGEALSARMVEIARTVAREVGTPINVSMIIQAGFPAATFASMADLVAEIAWEETIGNSLVLREPAGVVGAITPWNYPLHQLAAKVAPALVAGCTIVVKPSEVAPLTAFALADVVDEVGLPAGVFNLVSGIGGEVGEAIVVHEQVDMVSFTGSTRAGRRVAELAAASLKKVALELGGKSATLVLPDADLARAVASGAAMCFLNSGQTCVALSRLLVAREQLARAEEIAATVAASYVLGNPLEESTSLGPLVSAAQRDRVRAYIRAGIAEGARLVTGGADSPEGLETGFFVRPTIFSDVRPDMVIAREEIFGPVLSIIAYDDEEEAIAIANDTVYGLAGAVWAAEPTHAAAVARRIRAGQVDINGGTFNLLAPFGGYKQSGHGRELGRFGLEEYLETKSLQL